MAFIQNMKNGIQAEKYSAEKVSLDRLETSASHLQWFIPLNKYTDTIHATSQAPEPKSRFIPSKWEAKRVRKIAYAIKMGWIDLNKVHSYK